MSEEDRRHWEDRWASVGMAPAVENEPLPVFRPFAHLFPTEGHALEVGCG